MLMLPAWSIDSTWKVWLPSVRFVYDAGLVATTKPALSRLTLRTSRLAAVTLSLPVKVKLAELLLLRDGGCWVMDTVGAYRVDDPGVGDDRADIARLVDRLDREGVTALGEVGIRHRAGRGDEAAAVDAYLVDEQVGRGDSVAAGEGEGGRRGIREGCRLLRDRRHRRRQCR